MNVGDPCVSISTGTLSPDRRVNYVHGMVLGLGEFLQEQQHFLEKGYLHERALHGYGTVYGLQVATEPTAGAADFTVGVSPGMAIDQWGREVVVRSAQCARLGAWLGAQEQANPGTIALHMGVSGEFTVYVVAAYAACLDDLVPVPGQPCSSSAQTKVASRQRDAWNIELRWSRPPMPAWDTDRRLARLLNCVQIVAGLDPSLSSEAEIIEAVRALPAAVAAGPDDLWPPVDWPPTSPPSSPPSGPVVFRLPAETAADALDRIFTVWVTQVRPLLSPALTQPEESSDPAVLLASITFTLGPETSPPNADPPIASCEEPDDGGRPYVLHTRLIQELRILAESGAAPEVVEAQQLATLTSDVDDLGRLILTAWFHLDQPVALTEPIQVASRSGEFGSFAPSAPADPSGVRPEFSDVWILTQRSAFPVIDRDQVAVSFLPASVFVGDEATTLADRVAQGLALLDTTPTGEVVVYGTVALPPDPPAPTERPAPPVLEFVTITPGRVGEGGFDQLDIELWFHPQPEFPAPRVFVSRIDLETIGIVEELSGAKGVIGDVFAQVDNVWRMIFNFDRQVELPAYLRFVFQASKIMVMVDGNEEMPVPVWMDKAGVVFLNWDPVRETISAYVRIGGLQ